MPRSRTADIDINVLKRLENHPWVARVAEYRFLRTELRFVLGRDLFASGGIDVGSDRLLRLLAKPGSALLDESRGKLRILDLGCGVGALGISIAKALGPERVEVVLTDRDRLAVELARENARLTATKAPEGNVTVLDAALGYDGVVAAKCEPFDLIVLNIPASVGDDGLYELMYGAGSLLKKGGFVAVVYVTPLDETMTAMRQYHSDTYSPVEVVSENRGKEHVAQLLRHPNGLPEFESEDALVSWRREEAPSEIVLDDLPPVPHYAVLDVPEFDTPHHESPLLVRLLEQARPAEVSPSERIAVLNPRHGFLAHLLLAARKPAELRLFGRDELELAVARRNVESAAKILSSTSRIDFAEPHPAWSWLPTTRKAEGTGFDVITGHLNWKEGPDALITTLSTLREALAPRGEIVLATGVGQIENLRRAAHDAGLRTGRELSRKGYTAIVLRMPQSSA